jgi:hypothetical protein
MPVQGHLEPKTLREEAHLTAEEAHGVDVGIGIRRDPGNARAESKTLSADWCSRGQQPSQREYRYGGLAHRDRVIESHV